MARKSEPTLFERAVLAAAALIFIALAAIVAASALGSRSAASLIGLAQRLVSRPMEAAIVVAVCLFCGLYLFAFALRRQEEVGIRQETEIGHVRISMRAIENLVFRTARSVRGVKDVEARVHPSPEGVAIDVSLVVHPDLQIPRLSEEVGYLVRSKVREMVGVEVGNVSIEVRNIAPEARARVE